MAMADKYLGLGGNLEKGYQAVSNFGQAQE